MENRYDALRNAAPIPTELMQNILKGMGKQAATEEGRIQYLEKTLKYTPEEAQNLLKNIQTGYNAFNDSYSKVMADGYTARNLVNSAIEGKADHEKYAILAKQLVAFKATFAQAGYEMDEKFLAMTGLLEEEIEEGIELGTRTAADAERLANVLTERMDHFALLLLGLDKTAQMLSALGEGEKDRAEAILSMAEDDYQRLAVAVSVLYTRGQLPQLGNDVTPELIGFFTAMNLETNRIILDGANGKITKEEVISNLKKIGLAVMDFLLLRMPLYVGLALVTIALGALILFLADISILGVLLTLGVAYLVFQGFESVEEDLHTTLVKAVTFAWGYLRAGYDYVAEFIKNTVCPQVKSMGESVREAADVVQEKTKGFREKAKQYREEARVAMHFEEESDDETDETAETVNA